MACIDKSLTPEQVDDRIEKYVLDKITYIKYASPPPAPMIIMCLSVNGPTI